MGDAPSPLTPFGSLRAGSLPRTREGHLDTQNCIRAGWVQVEGRFFAALRMTGATAWHLAEAPLLPARRADEPDPEEAEPKSSRPGIRPVSRANQHRPSYVPYDAASSNYIVF